MDPAACGAPRPACGLATSANEHHNSVAAVPRTRVRVQHTPNELPKISSLTHCSRSNGHLAPPCRPEHPHSSREITKLQKNQAPQADVRFSSWGTKTLGVGRARAANRKSGRPASLSCTLYESLQGRETAAQVARGDVTLDEWSLGRAIAAIAHGCDGVIASGAAIALCRGRWPKDGTERVWIVSPGIQPAGSGTDDDKRSTTPAAAIAASADYLVVGPNPERRTGPWRPPPSCGRSTTRSARHRDLGRRSSRRARQFAGSPRRPAVDTMRV